MNCLNGGNAYTVNSEGWLTKALADVKADKACCLVLSGQIAMDIIKHIGSTASSAKNLPFVGAILSKFPLPPGLPDPSMLVGALAALGAMGGMTGSLAVVASAAQAHGAEVDIVLRLSKMEIHIELTPKGKG